MVEDPQAGIAGREFEEEIGGAIGGAVVDAKDFEAGEGLAEQAVEGPAQELAHIEHRHDDGDQRRFARECRGRMVFKLHHAETDSTLLP